MYKIALKNPMLDEAGTLMGFVSAHDGYPGVGGANEVAGITRVAVTWAAAAAGNLDSSNVPVLAMGAGDEAHYYGFWSLVTAGTFYADAPLGGVEALFQTDAGNDMIQSVGHGLANDERVAFTNATPPDPLVEGTRYFVVGATADTFQVSATQGGAAIALTDEGAATCRFTQIVAEVFGAAGNLTLSDADLDLLLGLTG